MALAFEALNFRSIRSGELCTETQPNVGEYRLR
jgi:hypothetical protein